MKGKGKIRMMLPRTFASTATRPTTSSTVVSSRTFSSNSPRGPLRTAKVARKAGTAMRGSISPRQEIQMEMALAAQASGKQLGIGVNGCSSNGYPIVYGLNFYP
jgi:hypothetical protein